MKYFFIRSQLVFVSVILLLTFAMMMAIVSRFNQRWDMTKEKVFSISQPTANLLKELADEEIEVLAFYPKDDPSRGNFEFFLKECALAHPKFHYNFYDPDRMPRLTKKYQVDELYTVIIEYGDQRERIVGATEEKFTNALLRLANPKRYELCFVTGHGESNLSEDDRNGYRRLEQSLTNHNYSVNEILLARDKVPPRCDALVLAGPHRDLDAGEFEMVKQAFTRGMGILVLLDPMDPGAGKSYSDFMDQYGVVLGDDVIVDKMSRMVGGDFLVPLVSQYVTDHPVTDKFEQPTFFPVARSIQPSTNDVDGLEIVPLALSGSGSWGERNLLDLENGEAAFDSASDLAGPICLAVSVEDTTKSDTKVQGRMIVVGDSDFLSNAYIDLSGNKQFGFHMMKWLVKDERFIAVLAKETDFQPLFLNAKQRFMVMLLALGILPGIVLILGAIKVIWRKKTS